MLEKNTKILKLTVEEWKNASRDKRELSVCRELGMDILVLAKGNPEDRGRREMVDGFEVVRYTTRPLGLRVPVKLNRVASVFYFAHQARKLKPDIISGHDIVALFIGWLSTLLQKKKPRLVYDSHEFELGRAGTHRSRFATWRICHLERFLMNRCSFSIMVNDVIADEVQRIHKLKERPIVVRNIPNYWEVDKSVCINQRNELLSEMDSPRDFMLMYHGGVTGGRGIEMLLQVVSVNKNVCLVVLGNAVPVYLSTLQHQVEELGIMERVLFHPAVPIKDLWKYVGAADVGMITIPAIAKSYYYMLPNKFFENIQSETPVICSNFPAIEPLVNQFGLGLSCSPTDLDAINKCVERLRIDKELYNRCKENAKLAKKHLCWEQEKKVLLTAYERLL